METPALNAGTFEYTEFTSGLPDESNAGVPFALSIGSVRTKVGLDLNSTLSLALQAKPASKNRLSSVKKNFDLNRESFSGPVKGKRTSKFATARLFPDK